MIDSSFSSPVYDPWIQLIQRNANQGFRYLQSARNGVDPTMIPQGLMGPMMPLPLDASGMHVAQMDAVRSSPIPITALASALASATPEHQRVVRFFNLLSHGLI